MDGVLRIGALARQVDVLRSPDVGAAVPLLTAALRHVGHPATRSRGTIGGIARPRRPAAELPAVLLALDGEVVVRSATAASGPSPRPRSSLGPFTTALTTGELLTTVVLPRQEGRGFGFAELSRRHGDFALAGAIVLLRPARIVLFGLGCGPERALDAERALDQGRPRPTWPTWPPRPRPRRGSSTRTVPTDDAPRRCRSPRDRAGGCECLSRVW